MTITSTGQSQGTGSSGLDFPERQFRLGLRVQF
jgi:hypothetical protein